MKQLLERKHGTRIIVFALLLTMLAWLVPANVGVVKAAEEGEIPVDGGYLLFDKATGAITGYKGDITEVDIPEEYEGNKITSIGEYAFDGCGSLSSVNVPNSVTSIGKYAFSYCYSLSSVNIPASVTGMEMRAFYCSGLTSVNIPSGVTSIEADTFYGCKDLTSVNIPNGVMSIGESAFFWCSSLSSVSIPNSVTSIGESAFGCCSSLTSVNIPNSVTSIEEYAFYQCSGLSSVNISNSVTSIGESVFDSCSSLTSVSIPNSVTSIGESAFSYCYSLSSVSIPNSVTSIGESAFRGCSSLASIAVDAGNQNYSSQDGVLFDKDKTELIGYPGGKKSTSYEVPASVTTIGYDAFNDCSSLASIAVDADNQNYSSQDGVLFSKDKTELIRYPIGKKSTSYEVPASVTTIGYGAFACCNSLSSVSISNSVTTIESYAFGYCDSLSSVSISNSVTTIGTTAFFHCSGLTSVTIPNSVTTIEYCAFGYQDFVDFGEVKVPGFKIYGHSNDSAAAHYAKDNGFEYAIVESGDNEENPITKTEQTISCVNSFTKTYGDDDFFLGATTDGGGELSYKSSDEKVVTVDDAGKVTIKGAGKATIIITAAATEKYTQATKTVSITINNASQGSEDTKPGNGNQGGNNNQSGNGNGQGNPTATPIKKGTTVKDKKSNGSYIVTQAKNNGGTVSYKKPVDKKKTSVTIPAAVKILGKTYKVTAIEKDAFKGNKKLKTVKIGSNVKKIGANAFNNCKNLKNITIQTKKLTKKTVGAKAFKGVNGKATVKVPKGKAKAYQKLLRSKGLSKKAKVK